MRLRGLFDRIGVWAGRVGGRMPSFVKRPIFKKTATYLAIFVAAILGIALLLNVVMIIFVGGRQVEVPDIKGLAEADAIDALKDKGLKYQRLGEEYSADCPEHSVARQDPASGRIVKQGRKVVATLSKGPEFQEIPYCAGKPLRTARILIEKAGFVVGEVSWVSTARGYGEEVLTTSPRPGSHALRGSAVGILARKAYPDVKVIMADVVGRPYVLVKMELERLGIVVDESTQDKEIDPFRARISGQEPAPGYTVSTGDTVRIVVSNTFERRAEL